MIRAPEQVALHLPVAGPATRMLAYSIDAVVIIIVEISLFLGVFLTISALPRLLAWLRPWLDELMQGKTEALADQGTVAIFLVAALLAQFTIELGYFIFWEMVSDGRSLGKMFLRLRVVCDGGAPLGLRESLVRNLLRAVDLLPGSYAVGLTAMLLSKEGKRLGDLAAGTIVVRLDRPPAALPLREAAPGDLAAFRFDRAQLARLGSAERTLARQTLRRIDDVSSELAETILSQAVEALRARLDFPAVEAKDRRAFLQALLQASQRR